MTNKQYSRVHQSFFYIQLKNHPLILIGYRDIFFFVRGEKRMDLRTLCGTRTKQYPLNSKLPCFLARQWPRNRVSFKLLPIWSRLSDCRATHCPWKMVIPGLLLSCVKEIEPWFPWAGPRSVSLLTTPPATPASIGPPAVCRHMAEDEAAVAPIYLRFFCGPCRRPTRF